MNATNSFASVPVGSDPQQGGRCLAWKTALLCIDLQHLNCRAGADIHAAYASSGIGKSDVDAYMRRIDDVVLPNVRKLQEHFRRHDCEVIHVRIQSLTRDGRDRSLEHKELGLHAPEGSRAAEFLPEVAPSGDEIVINKTASGVFISTNIEYVLRNLCVSTIYVVGVFTNECISSAVRSSSDLGFRVHLVDDASTAITRRLHEATVVTIDGRYARVLRTSEVIAEVGGAAERQPTRTTD